MKPLGGKAYGSIPHLPGSRLGPGDHHCSPGQAVIACEKARDKHDRVIVQEKLDGSNVVVANVKGEILALTRSGYLATTSKYEQHHRFAQWVEERATYFKEMLMDGERACGEWLVQAHGTKYNLKHTPFVIFDLIYNGVRMPHLDFVLQSQSWEFDIPHTVSIGPPVSIEGVMKYLGECGFHGACDPVEGAVWRVERKGVVDFLCKYVRHDKEDGKYFPEYNDGKITWNI